MANEYLLDSNTSIYILKSIREVQARFERARVRFLPFITAAELLFGAKKSGRVEQNLRTHSEFISRFVVLYPDRYTLEVHSDIRLQLKLAGRPIPSNDVWLAAITLQYDAILVTNDKHFAVVPGLRTENWLS